MSEKTAKKERKLRIIFVCTGNTCRSPMAEAIFKDELAARGQKGRFIISSAGLDVREGDGINPSATEALARLGYKKHTHTATFLTLRAALAADLIVCMTDEHKRLLGLNNAYTVAQITGGAPVTDPYGMPVEEYVRTAKMLKDSFEPVITLAVRLGRERDEQAALKAALKKAAKKKK